MLNFHLSLWDFQRHLGERFFSARTCFLIGTIRSIKAQPRSANTKIAESKDVHYQNSIKKPHTT